MKTIQILKATIMGLKAKIFKLEAQKAQEPKKSYLLAKSNLASLHQARIKDRH